MTDTLQKALSILTAQASNPMALEAIVEAMEACLEGGQYDGIGCSGDSLKATVEAPVKPKIVWANKDGTEEWLEYTSKTVTIARWDDECIEIAKEDIPKLEAALAKARELGWFE